MVGDEVRVRPVATPLVSYQSATASASRPGWSISSGTTGYA